MRSFALFAALALALPACAAGATSGFESDGGADDAASTPPDDGGAIRGPDAATDAAPNDGGTPASDPSSRLYPLRVGYTWTYDVEAVGAGAVCAPGTHASQVTGTHTVDSRGAYDFASFCAAAGTSELSIVDGSDEIDVDYQGAWLKLVDGNLKDGETWSFYNTSYTWHREASVTVPAGTFTDCWTAKQNVTYTAYTTYCRGAGVVRSYSADLTGAGWDAKLVSKSF